MFNQVIRHESPRKSRSLLGNCLKAKLRSTFAPANRGTGKNTCYTCFVPSSAAAELAFSTPHSKHKWVLALPIEPTHLASASRESRDPHIHTAPPTIPAMLLHRGLRQASYLAMTGRSIKVDTRLCATRRRQRWTPYQRRSRESVRQSGNYAPA